MVAVVACGSDDGTGVGDAAMPDAPAVAVDAASPDANAEPLTLGATGLYASIADKVLASGVEPFTPSFPLWSDGADKSRWVMLPDGASIDTADMDFWVYPEGTKLWKEFVVEGKRVETRLLWKRGPSYNDWYFVSYLWNDEETDAAAAPDGAMNVRGTSHDIPDQSDCRKCHSRQPDFVLGFSALQLAHSGAGVQLESLVTGDRLTVPPSGTAPYFAVPGSGVEQASLGYLHGNCGGCHHRDSDVMDSVDVNLRLEVATLTTVDETTVYSTSVAVSNQLVLDGVTALIEPGDPDASAIYVRMNTRGNAQQMPPAGTELVDQSALDDLAAWITSLAP